MIRLVLSSIGLLVIVLTLFDLHLLIDKWQLFGRDEKDREREREDGPEGDY